MSQSVNIRPDENGNNPIVQSYESDNYTHIAGATAGIAIKVGAGTLCKITVNTKGTTATLTAYDNTIASGNVIAVVDLSAQIGTLEFGVAFALGCYIVVTGTLSDVTVTYR